MDTKNWINLFGILGVVIGILLLFNISEMKENSKITAFNYSDDQFSFNATGTDIVINKDYKSSDKIYIKYNKNSVSNSSLVSDYYNMRLNNSSGNILATYNKTNANGVSVFCSVIKTIDPKTQVELEFYNFFVQDKTGQIREISIFGDNSNNKINSTADLVFDSIKIE